MNRRVWREYGNGAQLMYATGIPRVVGEARELPPCPQCRCETLFEIDVAVRHPSLGLDGHGRGRYVGCPACSYASNILMTSNRA